MVETAGAQQALYLTTRLLVDREEVIAVEDPGYPPFRKILDSIGAKLVNTTPSHQFLHSVTARPSLRSQAACVTSHPF